MTVSTETNNLPWPKGRGGVRSAVGFLASLLLLVAALGWMLRDAAARRVAQREQAPQVRAIVRLLGVADLALSSSSRWLRHPSVTEPGAPFADGPAILDNDPAGAAISPPGDVLAGSEAARVGWVPQRGRR
jgi:hypothetical protein